MVHHGNATQTGGFFVSVVDHQDNAERCFRGRAEEKGSHSTTEDLKACFKGEGRRNIDAPASKS